MPKQYNYVKEGLADKNFQPLPWLIITGFIVILGSFLFANSWFTVFGVRENLVELGGDVFLKYLFIVVAVERAADVFVGMYREQGEVDWTLRINRIREVLQKDNLSIEVLKQVYTREHRLITHLEKAEIIGKIDDVPQNPSIQDYVGFLTSAKQSYEFQRARFNSISNRYVARIVFFVGIILATLGLSIFQDILQNLDLVAVMGNKIENHGLTKTGLLWQTGFMRFADIMVTGGLLGGGSVGLNSLSNRVTNFLNKS